MIKCINTSHKDYVRLLETSSEHPFVIEADVAAWQEKNSTDLFPTLTQLYPDSKESRLTGFMFDLGFTPMAMREYKESYGKRVGAGIDGIIDGFNKVIGYTKGSITEEAAHLAVFAFHDQEAVQRSLVDAAKSEEYANVQAAYRAAYKELNPSLTAEQLENKVRLEVLGKLVAKAVDGKMSGRLGDRLKRLWKKFVSLVKGNKDLQSFIEEVSTGIVENKKEAFTTEVEEDILFSLDFKSTEKTLESAIGEMKTRLKSMKDREGLAGEPLVKLQEQINVLETKMMDKQFDSGILKMLEYFKEDSDTAYKFIQKVNAGQANYTAANIQHLEEFLSFYTDTLTQLEDAIELKLLSIPKTDLKQAKKAIKKIGSKFKKVHANVNKARKDWAISQGYENVDTIEKDLSWVERMFSSLRAVKDGDLRKIWTVVATAQKKADQMAISVSRDLQNFLADRKVKSTKKFAETYKGKSTGFYMTKYQLGGMLQEMADVEEKLREKHSTDGKMSKEQEIAFSKEFNTWKGKNLERRFISEYYELQANLSLEAREAKKRISDRIAALRIKGINKEGDFEYDLLSEEDFKILEDLEQERKALSNSFYHDGTKKSGIDLEIAIELKEYGRKIGENADFTQTARFKKIAAAKKDDLATGKITKEQYKKWMKRNTNEAYSKEFWKLLSDLDKADYGADYVKLQEEKSELMRRYSDDRTRKDVELIPTQVVKRVKDIEIEMKAIRDATKSKTKSEFNKIAKIRVIPEYATTFKDKKANLSAAEFKEWYDNNHINEKPTSVWTFIEPINPKHIIARPKQFWMETSDASAWKNPKFDESWQTHQPTDKWLNKDYDKLSKNDKKVLNELVRVKQEADALIGSKGRTVYMLPQITQSNLDLLRTMNKGALIDNLKSVYTKTEDETEYGFLAENGKKKRLLPKFFNKLLKDPSIVSTDLMRSTAMYLHMAHNYHESKQVMAEANNVLELVKNRVLVNKKGEKAGVETNAYLALKTFIDRNVYGERMQSLEIGGYDVSKGLASLEKFTTNLNLSFNPFTPASGFIFEASQSRVEGFVGEHTTNKAKLFATKEYWKNASTAAMETDSPRKSVKYEQIAEMLGLESISPFSDMDKSRMERLGRDSAYGLYTLGGHIINRQILVGMLYNLRNMEGQLITRQEFKGTEAEWDRLDNVYDMFESKNFKSTVKPEFKDLLTPDKIANIGLRVEEMVNKLEGRLSNSDKTAIHQNSIAKLFLVHRSWLIQSLQDRFHAKGKDALTGKTKEGYYTTYYKLMALYGKTVFNEKRLIGTKRMLAKWDTLEQYERNAVVRTISEIGMAIGIAALAFIIHNVAEEDEDDYALQYLSYVTNRALLEASVMPALALPFIGTKTAVIEFKSIIEKPVASMGVLDQLVLIPELLNWTEEIESGKYKGLSKAERFMMKSIPGLKGMSSAKTTESIKSSNNFLRMKALSWLYAE